MKKELLILSSAVATLLVTGCASTNPGYSSVQEPRSALAFTTVTDPKELLKWTNDQFIHRSLRSADLYSFQVPDTGYNPGARVYDDQPASMTMDARTGDMTYRSGAGAPGAYESGTRSYKTILYRPGHVR